MGSVGNADCCWWCAVVAGVDWGSTVAVVMAGPGVGDGGKVGVVIDR